NTHATTRSISAPPRHAASAKRAAVPASTIGYRQEMADSHSRQRPRRARKLNTGMLSNQCSSAPQARQCERETTMLSFWGNRMITTLRKLPMIAPARVAKGTRDGAGIDRDSTRGTARVPLVLVLRSLWEGDAAARHVGRARADEAKLGRTRSRVGVRPPVGGR